MPATGLFKAQYEKIPTNQGRIRLFSDIRCGFSPAIKQKVDASGATRLATSAVPLPFVGSGWLQLAELRLCHEADESTPDHAEIRALLQQLPAKYG